MKVFPGRNKNLVKIQNFQKDGFFLAKQKSFVERCFLKNNWCKKWGELNSKGKNTNIFPFQLNMNVFQIKKNGKNTSLKKNIEK